VKRGGTIEERPVDGNHGPTAKSATASWRSQAGTLHSLWGRRIGELERTVTGESSLPPIKKGDGKMWFIALFLLLGAGALWFFSRGGEPKAEAAPEATPLEPPVREQFAPELEIPEEEDEPPAEPRRASAPDPAYVECTGTISAAEVRGVIQGAPSKQVQTCYEQGLKNNNTLQGSMQVELTIGTGGEVIEVEVRGNLRDRQVYSCVRRVAQTWKFPSPSGGCVRINAPFQMTPKL
jgi:hypothetical protein